MAWVKIGYQKNAGGQWQEETPGAINAARSAYDEGTCDMAQRRSPDGGFVLLRHNRAQKDFRRRRLFSRTAYMPRRGHVNLS